MGCSVNLDVLVLVFWSVFFFILFFLSTFKYSEGDDVKLLSWNLDMHDLKQIRLRKIQL